MTLKEKIVEYRNSHKETRTLLGTVLGEFERNTDIVDQRNPTDIECIVIIKKMIESNKLTKQFDENVILEQFLPKQLNKQDINIILDVMQFISIGECMKHFKENYPGLYNGQEVSKEFNKLK